MRRSFLLLSLTLLAIPAFGQLQASLTWTTPSAAATITVNTSGIQTAGPVISNLYRAAATITAGVASCQAFSTTAYSLLTGASGVPGTSSTANANTFADKTGTVGQTYCYAVTNQFQSGGNVSAAAMSPALLLLLFGSPAAPTSFTGSAQASQ